MKHRTGTLSLDETSAAEQVLFTIDLARERLKRFYFIEILGGNTTVVLEARLYVDNAGTWERLSHLDLPGVPAGQSLGYSQGLFTASNIEIRLVSTGLGAGSVDVDYRYGFDDFEDVANEKYALILTRIKNVIVSIDGLKSRIHSLENLSQKE